MKYFAMLLLCLCGLVNAREISTRITPDELARAETEAAGLQESNVVVKDLGEGRKLATGDIGRFYVMVTTDATNKFDSIRVYVDAKEDGKALVMAWTKELGITVQGTSIIGELVMKNIIKKGELGK